MYVDVIYTDFSKAFDKVSHPKLLKKLEGYGIIDKALEWFKSFLLGRRQRVILGNELSDWEEVTSGVPQESVLGPVLFVIYINDLLESFDGYYLSYADDLKLIGTVNNVNSISHELQNDLDRLTEWSKLWSTELNILKCKALYFGKNRLHSGYHMSHSDGLHTLEETKEEKDLGVIV